MSCCGFFKPSIKLTERKEQQMCINKVGKKERKERRKARKNEGKEERE